MLKRLQIIFVLITAVLGKGLTQPLPTEPCQQKPSVEINNGFPKAAEIQKILDEIVNQSIPGVSVALYSQDGWWAGVAGYAKLEGKVPMHPCHLLYLQSIAKTYMAVAILKLYDQGKIDINAPITKFLPESVSKMVTNADSITVKQLMNHTSGVPEYNSVPAYITKLLQEPNHEFQPIDYIKYIEGKPLTFKPGSRYSYRNTNYVLLALIADYIAGDHAKLIEEVIFKPLALKETYYRGMEGYLKYPRLVNSYWDRFSNGVLENSSELQRNNVQALVGDDGIVTTPVEAVMFLRGLLEEKLITASSLNLMKEWANDRNGNPTYGLGLDHAEFVGHTGYGHSGGGIGAGCQLYYFPEKGLYMFVGINLGTVTDSPIHAKALGTLDQLYKLLLD
ncbi:MAG: serine hydrolase domain-containing protein [Cyclobacteriaceae bacterium]